MYEILYREKGKRIQIVEIDNYEKVKNLISKFDTDGVDYTVSYKKGNKTKIIAFSK